MCVAALAAALGLFGWGAPPSALAADAAPEATAPAAEAALVLTAPANDADESDTLPDCCVEPDLWLICTRSAPCCCNLTSGTSRITFRHRVANCWQSSDLAQFLASDDPAVCTVFLIPGNRADADTAVQFGMLAARRVARYGCGRKLRAVIWSWPADRSAIRNRTDVKEKTDRSDCEAWYLAWLLNQMNPQIEVGLMGYSLGARAIGGALHMLAGGTYDGRCIEVRYKERKRMGVAMFAAAIECDWFRQGRPMDRTLSRVDRILVTTNPSDPLLRFYPHQRRPNTDPALGFQGPCCLGELRCVLTVRNVSGIVGHNHNWRPYLYSCCINKLMAEHILGPCGQPTTTPAPTPATAALTPTAPVATAPAAR